MEVTIDHTSFGAITIDGETFDHDVIIRLSGKVRKRKKKLSKEVYGTSHKLSLAEAEFVYEKGADTIVIGSGQDGMLELSDEASNFFKKKKCHVSISPTPEAINVWNTLSGGKIGLFHITC
jgi:hypothetical protein